MKVTCSLVIGCCVFPFFVACCFFIAHCLSFVVFCALQLFLACCLLRVVYCWLLIACRSSFVASRLSLVARDLAHYQQVYREQILTLPHIADIEALMTVSEVKRAEVLPI